jgi:tetratricopeptide (TPR) repeat protein
MNLMPSLKLAAVVLLAAVVATPDAHAQIASRRGQAAEKEASAPLYPDATRKAPSGQYSPRLKRQIDKLMAAYNEESPDPDTVIAAAEELITNERATAFDKGMAQLLAGSTALSDGRDELAITYFSQALEGDALNNDNHYSAMLSLASAYVNTEQFTLADPLLARMVQETSTTNPTVYALQASSFYNQEKFAESIAPLRRAIELKPDGDPALPQMLMSSYAELGQDGEAVRVAEELYNANPDDRRALLNLALLYSTAEMPEKAAALLDSARATGKFTDAADYQRLVAAYYNLDRQADAANVLDEGITKGIMPANATNYLQLAQFRYFSENIPAAVEAAKKGAAVADNGEVSLFLAQVLDQEDRNEETKAAAKQALEKGLDNPGDAWMVLARAEFYSENIPAAQAAYREAMKDPKTREQAQKALAQISR